MKLRTLAALICALVLSLGATSMVFAGEPDCGQTDVRPEDGCDGLIELRGEQQARVQLAAAMVQHEQHVCE